MWYRRDKVYCGTMYRQYHTQLAQHGFGMRSIQRVVDKYDGYLRYYVEDLTFVLQIVLMLN